MSFVGFLEAAGKDFAKGLGYVVKIAVPVEALAKLLFPQFAPAVTAGVDAATLIQNAVLLVEQKWAAAGKQNGTGAQKLAEVMTLAESAVTAILTQFGVHADTAYVTSLVNAVVAVLNVAAAPASASVAG
ncbi:hypothetical protein SAMN05421771_0726 [Granulicella pectinivorans]|jgi:hypothetical protein|uniref:Uncharacterized protein n=1 Tax=Granulicella pectinivorans TaxID=474950 RepID=A0A1I6LHY4_9BACT|nr:hypothetical protein [Granulicella pectinivorans]SFS02940.1 hypothetical protein SAMN05421771_0726 [Granulicella pectinivorans]